jgi:hypothetical protein
VAALVSKRYLETSVLGLAAAFCYQNIRITVSQGYYVLQNAPDIKILVKIIFQVHWTIVVARILEIKIWTNPNLSPCILDEIHANLRSHCH